jgi:hypothetical protein
MMLTGKAWLCLGKRGGSGLASVHSLVGDQAAVHISTPLAV